MYFKEKGFNCTHLKKGSEVMVSDSRSSPMAFIPIFMKFGEMKRIGNFMTFS